MQPPTDGRGFLGVGADAPCPSGEEDPEFRAAMLAQLQARGFRFRVNVWSVLWRWRKFPWPEFESRLKEAQFRGYGSTREALQSLGWSGRAPPGARTDIRTPVALWRRRLPNPLVRQERDAARVVPCGPGPANGPLSPTRGPAPVPLRRGLRPPVGWPSRCRACRFLHRRSRLLRLFACHDRSKGLLREVRGVGCRSPRGSS
jgi:hypothetical protein